MDSWAGVCAHTYSSKHRIIQDLAKETAFLGRAAREQGFESALTLRRLDHIMFPSIHRRNPI